MNKEVKEELKEFIFQAIQAGKSESSNLASDIARKIREGNSDTVKRLDDLTNLVKNHIEHDKEWKFETDNWKKTIDDWIANSTPAITAVNKTRTFGSVTSQIGSALLKWGSVGTLVYGIYIAIKKRFL